MRYINYPALVNQMRLQKPFRGSTNRFPLGNRKHSHKYFLWDEEQSLMRIILGWRYQSHSATKEEYDADPKAVSRYENRNPATGNLDGTYGYTRWETIPNEVGIVRADNSYEFTGNHYGQGDMTILSGYPACGYFKTDGRRGGMIFKTDYRQSTAKMMPIFKGLRVDCDTMYPLPESKYQVIGMRVNRKNSREFLKRYEDFFKVAEVMMKTIDYPTFVEIGAEQIDELFGGVNAFVHYLSDEGRDKMLARAEELMLDSPLDAAALFCYALGRGIGNYRWHVRAGNNAIGHMGAGTTENYVAPMRRGVSAYLYKRNSEVMNTVTFGVHEPYPASDWGYSVEVNGEVKEQY